MHENVDADMCMNGKRVRECQIEQAGHEIQTDQIICERKGPIDRVAHEYVGNDDQHDREKANDRDRSHGALDAGESRLQTTDHSERRGRMDDQFAWVLRAASNSFSTAVPSLPRPSRPAAQVVPTPLSRPLNACRVSTDSGSNLTPLSSSRLRACTSSSS